MTNTMIISIDTERDNPISISKPKETILPTNPEDAKNMILLDINCLVETLYMLIDIADHNKYATKRELVEPAIVRLHSLIAEPPVIEPEILEGKENGK